MEDALRNIDRALKERRTASRIDNLLPVLQTTAPSTDEGLGIEHYGKVSMVVEGGSAEAATAEPAVRPSAKRPYEDAASRIAAGSKELSLEDLSQQVPTIELLKGTQLGGSRFHEISLDDLSAPPEEEKTD